VDKAIGLAMTITTLKARVAELEAAPDGDWLWAQLMDWCRSRGYRPAEFSDLFAIVARARAVRASGNKEGSR
jgi:hypothetical protein